MSGKTVNDVMGIQIMDWLSVFNVGFITQALLTVVSAFLVYKCAKFVFDKAMVKQSGNGGRRLNNFESLLNAMSVEKGGAGNICLRVSLTSKQSLSHQHVRDALVLLAKRHPMLRATITTVGNESKYFKVNEIHEVISMLNITTSGVKCSDWKDIWFEYAAKQFGNGLLWRVVVLREEFVPITKDYANTLMFTFNHCSSDGVSCVKFCKQFLGYMNQLANGVTVEQETSFSVLPYFHDIVMQKRLWPSLLNFVLTFCGLRPILRYFMPRMVSYFKKMECNPFYTQFPPRLDLSSFTGPCRLNAKVFTEDETRNILKACKEYDCTVTGALAAAANLAFCELVQDGMKGSNVNIKWEFPINGQRFCNPKPPQDYLGYFTYSSDELYMKYVHHADVDFWKVAQETTKEIQDNLKAERYITKETVFSKIFKPKELIDLLDREMLIRLSSCNLVSSIGSFDFDTCNWQQAYKLHECSINVCNHGLTSIFSHHNHTINGKMSWQITHDASRVEIQHAETFANLCFGRFIEIARGHV